jgi:hypothetical protein
MFRWQPVDSRATALVIGEDRSAHWLRIHAGEPAGLVLLDVPAGQELMSATDVAELAWDSPGNVEHVLAVITVTGIRVIGSRCSALGDAGPGGRPRGRQSRAVTSHPPAAEATPARGSRSGSVLTAASRARGWLHRPAR